MGSSKDTKRKPGRRVARGSRRRSSKKAGSSVDNSSGAGVANERAIRIRMYNVGFGDCFLLSLPAQRSGGTQEISHILIDCGGSKLNKVVDDIATVTGRKLAIVIATHAHKDHVCGFDENFSRFEIGEVWMPWTWNPDDDKAVALQKNQAAIVAGLIRCSQAMPLDPVALSAVSRLADNHPIVSLLKSGLGVNAKPRYLKAGDVLVAGDISEDPKAIAVPGLSVCILGPPETEEFLRQMDPPPGEHYLHLSLGTGEDSEVTKPFGDEWVLSKKELSKFKEALKILPEYEKELQDRVKFSLSDLAFAIDQARNNESIVALFTFRGQYLLFPGDAQYGNWRYWLEDPQSEETLKKVTFLKVAHHGSVNATPKDALENMSDGKFAAMVSTKNAYHDTIPCVPLMDRLKEKTKQKVVRSDQITLKDAPEPFPAGFVKGDFWVDYFIAL
jgi:beta-lactamase superfamily II metal-dependent hydrolase